MKLSGNISQYLAEFIGTFFLVFFGCGSMVLAELYPSYDSGFIPVIWGGVVSIMIYAVGHISGAHFNPAVTLSFFLIKKLSKKKVLGFIISQVLGAILASFVHFIIWGANHKFGLTEINISLTGGIIIEFLLSFVLMFVITSVATDSRAVGEFAGIAIGSTVALCAFVGGPLTNASMNPARSIGPAIVSGNYLNLSLYIVVPIIGAFMGAKTYEWIKCHKENVSDDHGCC